MINRVLVAGGGTGGHLFPGIAVVEEIRRRLPQVEVLFVGTQRGIEARVLPSLGERFQAIDVKPLVGRSAGELLRGVVSLPRSGLQALSVLRSFRPDLAIGLGGYAAGPLLLSAAALRIPSALLEQNANVGLTNRLLGKSVGRAYLTYPETSSVFGASRTRMPGNPVRRAFVDAARMAGHDPAGVEARSRNILVLGGSQGARALNEVVPKALARAGLGGLGISIVHQSGAPMAQEVERAYRELGLHAEVVPFIDDVAKAYVRASLVIARAGATTLAELCAIGRPSILVPYPHAAADHQTGNALALERAGAALSIAEHELTEERLASEVHGLLSNGNRRRDMAEAARRAGRPDAAAAIVDDLLAWLGVPTASGPAPQAEEESDSDPGPRGPHAFQGVATLERLPIQRRPKIKRAELRVRPIELSIDAVR
jgi:UDP-N-acetylglucosamine--N-acetylmuramyl-(pentapeptide) pyrophosphoryl-undecaprenol N-acetylglucosamine transferase